MSALAGVTGGQSTEEIDALAKGGRTNIIGFMMRLVARLPFLFIAGRLYGPDTLGTFARAVLFVVEPHSRSTVPFWTRGTRFCDVTG